MAVERNDFKKAPEGRVFVYNYLGECSKLLVRDTADTNRGAYIRVGEKGTFIYGDDLADLIEALQAIHAAPELFPFGQDED